MRPNRQYGWRRPPAGFTLVEVMMAVSILLVVVVSVTAAVTAGQQHAFEAHQRIGGTLAAEALLARLLREDYDALGAFDGYTEPVGAMSDAAGDSLPGTFRMVGRSVRVTTTMQTIDSLGVNVRGRTIHVEAFNAKNRILAEITMFFPEPQP
ncbi:MAG: prepilin-type N-terminal cleavage/methylation domain-containing protein [Planctomycetes bacterium]|nr:prepilin-type N-terminal cleavage/methylation domain-containing protein [Planctomycetota bacterium]